MASATTWWMGVLLCAVGCGSDHGATATDVATSDDTHANASDSATPTDADSDVAAEVEGPPPGQDPSALYDIGTPTLAELWVSPNGADGADGLTRTTPLKSLYAAWAATAELGTTGYRINLLPGTYPCEPGDTDNCLNDFADRAATFAHPIIVRAVDGPGTVTLRGGLNLRNLQYVYLLDLTLAGGGDLPTNAAGNNLLHLEACDHMLLRGLDVLGPDCPNDSCNNLQEVFKVNQAHDLHVESSHFRGAWHTVVDYFSVQVGAFVNNRIDTAGQWCMYVKGGSAYLRVAGNELSGCLLGFQAGQGSNETTMRAPWVHYEVYDVKFVNNLVHDIPGVGMSVAGGYDVLFAFNTLYRVGTDTENGYPMMQFVRGGRGCSVTDEFPNAGQICATFVAGGGWGTRKVGLEFGGEWIPNRHVFVYDNVFYNPSGSQTMYSHFGVNGPVARDPNMENIPDPVLSDDDLRIVGNVVWNGPSDFPIGVEEADAGCQPANASCNLTQLTRDNRINAVEPQLADPAHGDFRPAAGGPLAGMSATAIPDFSWADVPSAPVVPAGTTSNAVSSNRAGESRATVSHPGAY